MEIHGNSMQMPKKFVRWFPSKSSICQWDFKLSRWTTRGSLPTSTFVARWQGSLHGSWRGASFWWLLSDGYIAMDGWWHRNFMGFEWDFYGVWKWDVKWNSIGLFRDFDLKGFKWYYSFLGKISYRKQLWRGRFRTFRTRQCFITTVSLSNISS